MTRWALITGEYPPQPGGVGDYTQLVARELRRRGEEVFVFTTECGAPEPAAVADGAEPVVHRLAGGFGPLSLISLQRRLRGLRPDRIVVQYVPHAFGVKAMNVPFAYWATRHATRLSPLWVMFHEVASPLEADSPLRHRAQAHTNRFMAGRLASAASRIFVSIPAWAQLLRELAPSSVVAEWLPVPSNIPRTDDEHAVRRFREAMSTENKSVIGHFSAFHSAQNGLLSSALERVLALAPESNVALIGHGSRNFAESFARRRSAVAERVRCFDKLTAADVAACLSAADVLFQPYQDGVSCRRGSAMACLAAGRPLVTNLGPLSEPDWSKAEHGVRIVCEPNPQQLAQAVLDELALSSEERAERGRRSAAWYQERFALNRTVDALCSPRAQQQCDGKLIC